MKKNGYTMIEIIVVLAVIMILASTISAVIIRYVENARVEKADSDTSSIRIALLLFSDDTGLLPRSNGSSTNDQSFNVVFFGSSKNLPRDNVLNEWGIDKIKMETNPEKRDILNYHFLHNDPNTNGIYGDEKDYPSFGKKIWHGPYFDIPRVDQDPWGRAYVISFFKDSVDGKIKGKIVSAGPNGILETRPLLFCDIHPSKILDPIPFPGEKIDDIVKIFEKL